MADLRSGDQIIYMGSHAPFRGLPAVFVRHAFNAYDEPECVVQFIHGGQKVHTRVSYLRPRFSHDLEEVQ